MMSFLKSLSPLNSVLFPSKPPSYDRESAPSGVAFLSMSECLSGLVETAIKIAAPLPCLILEPHGPLKFTLLYFHGNYEDLADCQPTLLTMSQRLGARVIAPEFPGYGAALGSASEDSIDAVALAALDVALQRAVGDPQHRIVVCGRSIGSGPAFRLTAAARSGVLGDRALSAVTALVTISAFTSVSALLSLFSKVAGALSLQRWDSLAACADIDVPVLLIHGALDELIPPAHSQQLCNAVAPHGTVRLVANACHNDGLFDEPVASLIDGFVAQHLFGLAVDEPERELNVSHDDEPDDLIAQLVFVHGFNNTPDTIEQRRSVIEAAFVGGQVLSAVWHSVAGAAQARSVGPTKASAALLYSVDNSRTDRRDSAAVSQVDAVLTPTCAAGAIGIVAHSRGSHVAVEWLIANPQLWQRVRRVALLHPDVNVGTLRRLLNAGFPASKIAVFDSAGDVATSTSGFFGMSSALLRSEAPSAGSRDVGALVGHHKRVRGTSHSAWLEADAIGEVIEWLTN